ncbi:MAG: hypothetical protein IKA36_04570 [Clostridia bacterium]|nr:hypothetical protein [Clostridia bacterium]
MKNKNSENLGYLNKKRETLIEKKNTLISSMRQTKPRDKEKVNKFDKRIDKKVEEVKLICDKIHREIRRAKNAGTWEIELDKMI